jgi:ABC-type glycerol-3-phosphate transport system permease component
MAAITQPNDTSRRGFIFEPFLSGGGQLILHAVLLGIGFVYVFPFIWMVGTSFKSAGEFFTLGVKVFPEGEWQWANLEAAWIGANFSQYFLNTVVVAVSVTFFVILFTSMAAFSISRLNTPGRNIVLGIIAVTFFMPSGYTILPTFEIIKTIGMLNSLGAVILVMAAGGMAFNTVLFYGYLRTIPHEVEEAAIIDGASVWQRYRYVVMPMSMPMVATVGLFTFMNAWNEFFIPLVFTLSRPELRTLAVGMYSFIGDTSRDWTLLCMGATISILPIIVVYVFLQRHFTEAFAGAVKS